VFTVPLDSEARVLGSKTGVLGSEADVPAGVRASTRAVLQAVQSWLAADIDRTDDLADTDNAADADNAHAQAGGGRLVIVTTGAVRVGDEAIDPRQAPVWGLVRAALAEHPGRFALIDTDGSAESAAVLEAVAASGEPEAALRAGRVHVPRLARFTAPPGEVSRDVDNNVRPDPPSNVPCVHDRPMK
jgi:pimaricinolide synthase PimS1